jgi:hypothetical protein
MTEYLYLATALAYVVAAGYDAAMTEKGLTAGLALEGNTFLVGKNPSGTRLALRDALYLGLFMLAGLANPGLYYGPTLVMVFKHVRGGLRWRYFLNGGKVGPDVKRTWLQKLFMF